MKTRQVLAIWRRATLKRSGDEISLIFLQEIFVSSKIVFDQKFSRIIVDSQSARRCHLMASSLMHSTLMVFVFACASLTDKPHLSVSAQFFFSLTDRYSDKWAGLAYLMAGSRPLWGPNMSSSASTPAHQLFFCSLFLLRTSVWVCECVLYDYSRPKLLDLVSGDGKWALDRKHRLRCGCNEWKPFSCWGKKKLYF